MSKRRPSKSSSNIFAVIGLILLLALISQCGSSLSKPIQIDKQATRSVRNTNSVIQKTERWETYHANATSVQETIEMDRVIATATAIYKRTIKPTLDYEATHEKFVSEIKQQQTVNAFLTEVSNQ